MTDKPKETNRLKCFICGQWQADKYMKRVPFNDIEELVCVACYNRLRIREDALEGEMNEVV